MHMLPLRRNKLKYAETEKIDEGSPEYTRYSLSHMWILITSVSDHIVFLQIATYI